jgi:peroxiredoxin
MKKNIRIITPIILIIALFYSGYKMFELYRHKKNQIEKTAHIPSFELKSTLGENFTNKNLGKNVPVVFFYFNSECEFCQAEIQDIVTNIKKFEGIQLLFVSFEPIQKIIMFQATYKLDIYDNVVFLSDYKNTFSETFGVKTLPSSLVYDKKGKLVSRNNGAVKVDYLLKALKTAK